MTKVSIIIPSFNDAAYLDDSVESAFKQTYKNFEVIIVNDGSTDTATLQKYDELQKKYPEIKIMHKENSGIGAARNTGISSSNGELLVPLDSDDKMKPTFLEKTIPIIESSNEIAIVNTNGEFFGDKTGEFSKSNYNPGLLAWENCVGNCCLFHKSVWEEVGGYSENIDGYEDWDLWIKIINKNYTWEHIDKVLIEHRYRKDSFSRKNNHNNYEKLTITLLENNTEFFQKYYKEIYFEGKKRWYLEYRKNK